MLLDRMHVSREVGTLQVQLGVRLCEWFSVGTICFPRGHMVTLEMFLVSQVGGGARDTANHPATYRTAPLSSMPRWRPTVNTVFQLPARPHVGMVAAVAA